MDQPENKDVIKILLAIIAKDSKNKFAGVQENTQISIDYTNCRAKVTTKDEQLNYLLEKAASMMWEIATVNPAKIGDILSLEEDNSWKKYIKLNLKGE